MKKVFYPYAFWWLGPIALIFMICIDLVFYTRFSEIRTPTLFILVFMLFIFGFPHWEVSVKRKSNKKLIFISEVIFYSSIYVLFFVLGVLLITIDREYRDPSKIYNVYKFDEIALFLTEGLIIVNSIFTIFVLLLRFKKP